ncbi:pyrroline-5-carboxylate reductase [Cohnella cholangitidis]|uniref:Pyrroline-5-carboxylate reductase n=1 Tax=Cohnella cholangitidis TaxID=2598458 RepID=A0A7G5C5E4_9BACL|nr:pyrroline-5-carboxylate reductase [Cohnella cholangitidis]QMV44428.1 pyrroline-5-carboxylate reductase [Cohnella cholangitidis]
MSDSNTSSLGNHTLCFYGAGSMAEAILRGLVEAKLADPKNITVMNRQNADRLLQLQQQYGVVPATTDELKNSALNNADVVLLGMKPKDAANAIKTLKPLLRPDQLIVSVIAGLSISTIHQLLEREQPVVRTMPNTSSTIGLGATGISFSDSVNDEQRNLALTMFNAVGLSAVVEEPLIEAVNGVSGSGPAYVYYLMEAMIDAGVQLGLTPEAARELTVQTVRGAAEMVFSTGENPGELRRKVTSPNGTTQAAIETLDRFAFQEGLNKAIVRCAERAREMGDAIRAEAVKD